MPHARTTRPGSAVLALAALASFALPLAARAHPPLDASGCYTKVKTGEYLCPRKQPDAAAALPGHSPVPNPGAHAVRQTLRKPMAGGCFVSAQGRTYTVTAAGKRNYAKC